VIFFEGRNSKSLFALAMLRSVRVLALSAPLLLCFWASNASAQDFSNCNVAKGLRSERRGEGHTLFYGSRDIPVQIDCKDMQFMADFIETFNDKNLAVAQGNVMFESGGTRIAADRMEFNFKTKTGVFYNASGTASMAGRADESMFGTQPPDAYFWGEEIHKLGPKKYRLVRGNFTTCVQPTPRWDIGSSSVTINLDDYALLRNSIFRVKSVPVMYLPLFYYPIQEDDRATGFLIPTYGASTIKGQTISNAFFWAINRVRAWVASIATCSLPARRAIQRCNGSTRRRPPPLTARNSRVREHAATRSGEAWCRCSPSGFADGPTSITSRASQRNNACSRMFTGRPTERGGSAAT
jgi:hypothetical protein